MMKKIILILGLLAAVLSGCNLPREGDAATSKEDRVLTAAAKTVAALSTINSPDYTPPPGVATSTPVPQANTPQPTPGPSMTPTSAEPCNRATFEGDVTIPDGSVLPPHSPFTKTWLIKNTGSCTWKNGYTVIFSGQGNAMSNVASFPIMGETRPGETAQISVNLTAPGEAGDYQGYWRLRSDQNQEFGTGPTGSANFFVQIKVADEYSFAKMACSAEWSTAAGKLPCPGKDSDGQGYAIPYDKSPVLEDGQDREGPGLLVMAQPSPDGWIVGKFPPVFVPANADFRALLSCQPGTNGCFVKFKVTYRVDNGDEQLLGEWNEGSEGGITNAIKDLDVVAGRSTAFSLYLYVTGTPEQSKGIWFNPRIIK
jgi:hypothetical protein